MFERHLESWTVSKALRYSCEEKLDKVESATILKGIMQDLLFNYKVTPCSSLTRDVYEPVHWV